MRKKLPVQYILNIMIPVILGIVVFTGCSTTEYNMSLPDDFAVYNKEKKVFKAVTAGGVKVRAYRVKNDPYGSLDMWFSAIDIHLKAGGYQKAGSEDFKSPRDLQGRFCEYRYLYNGKDYSYLLALLLQDDFIYVIESGGLEERVEKYKEAIISSMKGFTTGNDH